ncbi:hypothetical protein [Burkholderia gladioli]|uniref:hypothetical protein n=1 Tax=Burkholderia gladioli TaxID=28095 RepID=UPI00163E3383|nr:hypothetical protein [Burkholderia gladioli]
MLAALEGRADDPAAMPNGLHAAVIANAPTNALVTTLRAALAALTQAEKDHLRAAIVDNREPCEFLLDRTLQLPVVPDAVLPGLEALSTHLYARTAKLVGVERACGESIDAHFARFRENAPPGSGNVCCVCGTEYLAQLRSDIDDHEQWRGPYDHLLAKKHYPLYGVHPKNLLPICGTCNEKAKLAKDLLVKGQNRRLSFSPWAESASLHEIQISIDDTGMFPSVVINLSSHDANRQEKLDTWDDVYEIKSRVKGEFKSLAEKVAEHVSASSEQEFLRDLHARAAAQIRTCRTTHFNYWRARIYRAIEAMDLGSREALRLAIAEAVPQEQEMDELFFN